MRLLILGTGLMGGHHAKAFAAVDGVTVAGCADTDIDVARDFANTHGIAEAYGSLDAALEAGGFDAMTNVTPDAVHHPTTLRALAAGLHVFCEKPLAPTAPLADEMVAAAEAAGVVNGVNLTYRNVAALQTAREIVAAGRLGTLRHFDAAYLQSWLTQPAWGDWKTDDTWLWRLSTGHGSQGVLGDVGIHIFDFLAFAAGEGLVEIAADLPVFDKAPGGRIGAYKLDANDSAVMTARLEGGAAGVIHASRFASGHINDLRLRLHGDKAGLEVTNAGALGTLRICEGADLETGTWRDVPLKPVGTTYRRFAEAVAGGAPMRPDFADAARLQRWIDGAFAAHGSDSAVTVK